MKTKRNFRKLMALLLTFCLIVPSAVTPALAGGGKDGKKNFKEGLKYEAQQQWEQAVTSYALAVAAEPDNAEYKLRYSRALQNASIMYTRRGDELAKQGDFASAYDAYRKAYGYDQGNELAAFKMKSMLEMQKTGIVGGQDKYDPQTGRVKPDNGRIIQIENKPRNRDQMTDVSFKDIDLKECLKNLARNMNLNVLFDDSVKSQKINFDLHDVTLARAFDMVLMLNKLTFQTIDRKTVLVYADNPQVRGRYEQMFVKTYYIGNIKASDARNIINAIAPGRQAPTIEDSKIMVVKATQSELQLIQNVLEAVDKNLSEVVIDVEIYEVAHNTMVQIGNQVAASTGVSVQGEYIDKTTGEPKQYNAGNTASLSNFGGFGRKAGVSVVEAFAGTVFPWSPVGGLIGLPATTLSLLQSKGNTRLLNKMQVHALDGQSNTTKVGRSVPVSTGTNYGLGGFGTTGLGTTGGVTGAVNGAVNGLLGAGAGYGGGLFNNIQYKDVGLVIEAKPKITNEGYVEIQMKIETSNVEAAASADLNPSFTQRSLNTTARIRDGVTSIVASINQDSKTDSRSSIPVIGMLPLIGRLFTAPSQKADQSDIVITVTPHIIRSAEITKEDNLALLGGTISQGGQGAGLNPSVEEVLLRAQLEEENDRRLIAMQNAAPPTQQVPNSPLVAAPQSPLTASRNNNALPQTSLQTVGNFPNTALTGDNLNGPSGNETTIKPVANAKPNTIVMGNSTEKRPAETQPEVKQEASSNAVVASAPNAVPASAEAAAVAEWARQYNKTEEQFAAEAAAQTASLDPANAEKNSEEGKAKSEDAQPQQPVIPQATVRAAVIPDFVIKARQEAALKAAKERQLAASTPKPMMPQENQPAPQNAKAANVAPAMPQAIQRSSKPNDAGIIGESGFSAAPAGIRTSAPMSRVATLSLSAVQPRQQLGKPLAVNLQLDAQLPLSQASVTLQFDPTKLKIKAVKDGGLFGKPVDITYTEAPGMVTFNVSPNNVKATKNSGRLVVVEFETIGEGTSEIAISGAETQVQLAGAPANVNATSTQILVSREAVK